MHSRVDVHVFGRTSLFIAVIVSVIVIAGMASIGGSDDSGADPGITWRVDGISLYVEGTGDIDDYGPYFYPSWYPASASVTKIVVGEGITHVGAYSFAHFPGVTEVSLPSTLKSISVQAFRDCVALQKVTIPASVSSIESDAFTRCFSLAEFAVESGSASYSAKEGVLFSADGKSLVLFPSAAPFTEYSIPEGTEILEEGAFTDVLILESVTTPESLKTISAQCFVRCDELVELKLNKGLVTIGTEAVTDCMSLESIEIPSTVTTIGDAPFKGCFSLESISVAKGNSAYSVFDGALYDIDLKVLVHYPAALDKEELEIPSTVTRIAPYALHYARGLESVKMPASVKEIGQGAFAYSGLATVEITPDFETIGSYAFAFCDNLKSVTVTGAPDMDVGVFQSCIGLKMALFLSDDVPLKVASSMFYGCTALEDVSLMGVTEIGNEGFAYCSSLETINIPDSVTSIGSDAFYCCFNLKVPNLPSGLLSIGMFAFARCGPEEYTLTIPATVEEIGFAAFYGTKITAFDVDPGNTSYKAVDGVLFSYDGEDLIQYPSASDRKDYQIPEGTHALSGQSFRNVDSLQTLRIPASVTEILDFDFISCTLREFVVDPSNDHFASVDGHLFTKDMKRLIRYASGNTAEKYTVPDGVESIGYYAFTDCIFLEELNVPASVTEIFPSAFSRSLFLSVNVAEDNTAFSSVEGVLLDKDKTTIVHMSPDYSGNFVIPATVRTIAEGAMVYCEYEAKVAEDNPYFKSVDGWIFSANGSVLYYVPVGAATVRLSEDILTVAPYAISGYSVESLIFEEGSRAEVSSHALYDCSSLDLIRIYDGSRVFFDFSSLYSHSDKNSAMVVTFDAPTWFRMDPGASSGPVVYNYEYTDPDQPSLKFDTTFLLACIAVFAVVAGIVLFLRKGEPILE